MNLSDDGYCFVCGPGNPAGLKLNFHLDGESMWTEFTPKKELQGFAGILHGGIIATLLDETMVKLSIALGIPAVTARMDIRLRQAHKVGDRLKIEARILKRTRKVLDAYARAVTAGDLVVAEATGKLSRY